MMKMRLDKMLAIFRRDMPKWIFRTTMQENNFRDLLDAHHDR